MFGQLFQYPSVKLRAVVGDQVRQELDWVAAIAVDASVNLLLGCLDVDRDRFQVKQFGPPSFMQSFYGRLYGGNMCNVKT